MSRPWHFSAPPSSCSFCLNVKRAPGMQWCKWAGGWSSHLSRQVRGVARVPLNWSSETGVESRKSESPKGRAKDQALAEGLCCHLNTEILFWGLLFIQDYGTMQDDWLFSQSFLFAKCFLLVYEGQCWRRNDYSIILISPTSHSAGFLLDQPHSPLFQDVTAVSVNRLCYYWHNLVENQFFLRDRLLDQVFETAYVCVFLFLPKPCSLQSRRSRSLLTFSLKSSWSGTRMWGRPAWSRASSLASSWRNSRTLLGWISLFVLWTSMAKKWR